MKAQYEEAIFDLNLQDDNQKYLAKKSKILLSFDYFYAFYENLRFFIKYINRKIKGKQIQSEDIILRSFAILRNATKGTFLDVGCNIGAVTIPLAVRYPNIKFFAIDAHPLPIAQLIQNIRLNGIENINVLPIAISNDEGISQIFSEPNNFGGNRLSGFSERSYSNLEMDKIFCVKNSLRSIIETFGISKIDVLKIDVEGHELEVLKSMGSYLNPKFCENLLIEFGAEGLKSAGTSEMELFDFMISKSYRCFDVKTGFEINEIPNNKNILVYDLLFSV